MRRLEHIGSTSVPGLAAKPIIDMLLIVGDVQDEAAFVPPLEAAGFELRVREPGHRMLRNPQREAHLHLYAPGRAEERDYVDLRDWLRVSSDDRILYTTVKQHLALEQWSDMNDHADAKTDVVLDILSRARTWKAASARLGPAGSAYRADWSSDDRTPQPNHRMAVAKHRADGPCRRPALARAPALCPISDPCRRLRELAAAQSTLVVGVT